MVTDKQNGSVSVVMVSFHTGPVLWLSIESVLNQTGLEELIIVDNGNPEEVSQRLQEMAEREERLTVIDREKNLGFAAACNRGAEAASGEYLLFLNPDCLLPDDALMESVEAMQKEPDAWLAGCCLINPDGTEQAGARRKLLTPWLALVEGLRLYRLAPRHPYFARMNLSSEGETSDDKPPTIPATSGAFMLIRRQRYLDLGGMDEGYFLHVEDLDFCFQVQAQGGRIIYLPNIRVQHFLSTSKASSLFLEWNKAKGFTRYFYKHFRRTYPPGFLELVTIGIWVRFLLKGLVGWPFSLFQLQGVNVHHNIEQLRRLYLLKKYELAPEVKLSGLGEGGSVLVTGATGQVGISIVRLLLKAGVKVIALRNRKKILFEHPNLTWIEGDLSRDVLPLDDMNPRIVIQTASIWLLPGHLRRLHEAGVERVIVFGSTSLFGKSSSRNPYEIELVKRFGRAEEEVRQRCKELGMFYTILRPTLIYGVGLDRNVSSIRRFVERLGFFPVYPPASGQRQPVHVEDLAQASLHVMGEKKTQNESYNLSGGEVLTYREMVARIFESLDKKPRILNVPFLPVIMDLYARVFRKTETNGEIARRMNEDLAFEHEKATEAFGYQPRNFLEAGKKDLGDIFD